jgi:hypothetical protein
MSRPAIIVLIAALVGAPLVSGAQPTPIPGGAYQLSGVTGTLSSTLFNGKIRLRKMALRAPKDTDHFDVVPGDKGIVFTCLVANGTKGTRIGILSAKLVDADGVTLESRGGDPLELNYNLPPGAVARQSFRFTLKNGFTPVKVLVSELANGDQPVFRVNLKPGDLPS